MSQLRAWGASALVTAVLVALTLWRSPPGGLGSWALAAVAWAGGTVVVHLLLHNRWMRALDARSRAALARRRGRRPSGGADRVPRGTGAAPGGARRATADPRGRPPRRGAGHATHRGVGVGVPWPPNDTRSHPGRYHRRGRPLRREPR
jgi:hypothetical protein